MKSKLANAQIFEHKNRAIFECKMPNFGRGIKIKCQRLQNLDQILIFYFRKFQRNIFRRVNDKN